MIVTCEDCDEQICSDCDGERIGPGRYICGYCNAERERLEAEAKEANLPDRAELKECGACGKSTHLYIDKIEGIRCLKCAHELELKLSGVEHDAANCKICTPPEAA